MNKNHKTLLVGKKEIKEGNTIRFLMSTDVVDREGEVLTKDGWILPEKVPMIDSHNWSNAKDAFASVTVWQDSEGLWGEAKFASTQLGKDMFTLYSEDVLTQVSVGYLTYKAEYREIEGKQVYHIIEKELFELSAVLLAANKEAAKKMLEDGKIGKKSFDCISGKKDMKIEEMPSKKALDFLIDASEKLKAHRKSFSKLCKLFKIEAMDDEVARVKSLSEAITTHYEHSNEKSKKMVTPSSKSSLARTVSQEELDEIVMGAIS